MNTISLETNVSELLRHSAEVLDMDNALEMNPLLESLVHIFLSVLNAYDDYKQLENTQPHLPFPFTKDIPT